MTSLSGDRAPRILTLPSITVADLAPIREFVGRALLELDCAWATDAFVLAVDEVCANLAEHGLRDGKQRPVWIHVRTDASDAIIVVEDEGPSFNPADAPLPDLESDWDLRRVGGLGWFLVRQMVDEMIYEASTTANTAPPPRNRLTLIKRAGSRAPHIADS